MAATVNVNGRVFDQEHAVISVFDHGFLYGEGVYETWRTYNGQPFLFDRHMRRLRNSAGMIELAVPVTDVEMDERCRETMNAAHLGAGAESEAYVRVLLTRGIGELSYDPAGCPAPSIVIIVKPHVAPPPNVYDCGVMVALVPIIRNHPGTVNPLIKSNNLLNNALAMQEAYRRGAEEGLMCNYRGELSECSQSNFFMVRGGVALTPRSQAGLLEGITRSFLFDVGRDAGIEVRDETLLPADLETADEAFITSTTRELSPVTRIDDRAVGNGKPGPVTIKLLEGYRRKALELSARALKTA